MCRRQCPHSAKETETDDHSGDSGASLTESKMNVKKRQIKDLRLTYMENIRTTEQITFDSDIGGAESNQIGAGLNLGSP